MDVKTFEKLDRLGEDTNAKFEELYKQGAFKDLEKHMDKICMEIGKNLSVNISFELSVFDSSRQKEMSLDKCGISCFGGEKPYQVPGEGSTPHTYIVKGQMRKVPHDYCPECWGEWDFKMKHTTCPACGLDLGKDVKILLDTSVCPNCEDGKVTAANPKCDKCGCVVDARYIHWG